jgi:hypothetical protein
MIIDKIEIVTEYKHLQVRFAKPLFNAEGQQVSSEYERRTFVCGDFEAVAEQEQEVQTLANIYWTEELVKKYKDSLPNEEPKTEE